MATRSITVIACDIGGVVKNHQTDEPIGTAIESINQLIENPNNQFIFISKCGEKYKEKSNQWLAEQHLSHVPVFYCLEYHQKVNIAQQNRVNMMIDDRIQVLQHFPSSMLKIWFCFDQKKIDGAKKYQPEFVDSVRIARNWEDVLQIIEEIQHHEE